MWFSLESCVIHTGLSYPRLIDVRLFCSRYFCEQMLHADGFSYDQKKQLTSKLVTRNEHKDDGDEKKFIPVRVNMLIFSFDYAWVGNVWKSSQLD